jgi:hypothetical protein
VSDCKQCVEMFIKLAHAAAKIARYETALMRITEGEYVDHDSYGIARNALTTSSDNCDER